MDMAPSEIYTLSLHDALPISRRSRARFLVTSGRPRSSMAGMRALIFRKINARIDRKSTRLNSSHLGISYAVFCLKKKKKQRTHNNNRQNIRQQQTPITLTHTI